MVNTMSMPVRGSDVKTQPMLIAIRLGALIYVPHGYKIHMELYRQLAVILIHWTWPSFPFHPMNYSTGNVHGNGMPVISACKCHSNSTVVAGNYLPALINDGTALVFALQQLHPSLGSHYRIDL